MMKSILIRSLVSILCIKYVRSEPIKLTMPTVITPYEVVMWAEHFWKWLQNDWFKDFLRYAGTQDEISVYNGPIYRRKADEVKRLSDKIEYLRSTEAMKTVNLAKLISESREIQQIDSGLKALFDKLEDVELEYEALLMKLPSSSEELSPREICDYGNTRLSGDRLLLKILAIQPELSKNARYDDDYWPILRAKLMRDKNTACGKDHSAYEFMYSIYNQIVLTEMQGYVALTFSHYFVFDHNGTDGCEYSEDSADISVSEIWGRFEKRMQSYAEFFLPLMNGLPKDYRRCDEPLERDVTFIELEGAVQLVGMLPPYKTCVDISYANHDRSAFCMKYNVCYSLPRTCRGYVGYCRQDDAYENFCMDDPYSSRRYKWIKTDDSWNNGKPSGCTRYIETNKHEVYNCLCQCYDNHPSSRSTHIINLQSVESEVDRNMIVTGARFVVIHRVLHLQIQQGELGHHFQVDDGDWLPIKDISEEIFAARTNTKVNGDPSEVKENIDYYVIGYPFQMRLNDIQVPEDHVVSGMKFHVESHGQLVELAIISRPFNHSSGILDTSAGQQIVRGGASSNKLEFDRKYPLDYDPNRMLVEVPADNGYTEFQESDWETDSGQTTVPLLDAVPIVSNPSSPLGGIGIFLKQTEKSAALISLRFISLDYETYIKKSLDHLNTKMESGN